MLLYMLSHLFYLCLFDVTCFICVCLMSTPDTGSPDGMVCTDQTYAHGQSLQAAHWLGGLYCDCVGGCDCVCVYVYYV